MRHFKPIMLWLVALGVIAAALLWLESDVLWKVQQNNLFLFSTLFFKQTMVEPGGLLQYLGKFFTQFFYWPCLGTVLLCGWWLLLTWITKRALSIPDRWSALALAPTVILLAMNVSLGYWVYEMKLQGYYLMPTIGTTAVLALLWLFRVAKNEWVRLMLAVLTVVAGYPLMGAYALAAALLMILTLVFASWQRRDYFRADDAVVMRPVVSVKSSPSGADTKNLFILHEGTVVELLDTVGDWCNVRLSDGREGWLQKDEIDVI